MSEEEVIYIEAILLPLGEQFRTSLQEMTAKAAELLECGDFCGLDRVGHSIRGAAGYFGADRLKGLAADLERAALAADATSASEIIAGLRRVLEVMTLRSKDDLVRS